MSTVADILSLAAIYMGRTSTADLTINGFDAGTFAVNAARRVAERAHDFKYAEVNALLSIGAAGGILTSAYLPGNVTVTGTLSPNIATTFAPTGTFNTLPFYTATVSAVVYFLSYNGTAWTITPGGFTLGANYWILTTASTSPAGAYTAHGSNTGVATVAVTTAPLTIKRISTISLPIAGGDYEPIEFLTNDEFLGKVRRQIGRQNYDTTKALADLGVSWLNPFAYQNGNVIYLQPSTLPLPITAQLNCVRFMPDYVTGTDSDFFTIYGTEYLQWQSIVELNRYFRRFIPKSESNVDETAVEQSAAQALQAFIEWDESIARATTTPSGQVTPPSSAPVPAGNTATGR